MEDRLPEARVRKRSPLIGRFCATVMSPGRINVGGVVSGGRHVVVTPNDTGSPGEDRNVIQPIFSPQARPLNSPVLGSMVTPPPVEGLKFTQPIFSPQATPERVPAPSLRTP